MTCSCPPAGVATSSPGCGRPWANPLARPLANSGSASRASQLRDAVDSGRKPGLMSDEHEELVELRRRLRVPEMEMENEILTPFCRVVAAKGQANVAIELGDEAAPSTEKDGSYRDGGLVDEAG